MSIQEAKVLSKLLNSQTPKLPKRASIRQAPSPLWGSWRGLELEGAGFNPAGTGAKISRVFFGHHEEIAYICIRSQAAQVATLGG